MPAISTDTEPSTIFIPEGESFSTREFTPASETDPFFFARFSPSNGPAHLLFDLMNPEGDVSAYPPHLYKGFYRLAMDGSDASGAYRWVIGSGFPAKPGAHVDILLRPRRHFSANRYLPQFIDHEHASIWIHPESGHFVLENHSPKPIECVGLDSSGEETSGPLVIARLADGPDHCFTYTIHRRITRLTFGHYSFDLTIEPFDPREFQLHRGLAGLGRLSLPMLHIDPLRLLDSSGEHRLGDVIIADELFESLFAGLSLRSGDPFVVKVSPYIRSHSSARKREHKLMSVFSQERGSRGLLPTLCSQDSGPGNMVIASYVMRMALFNFDQYFGEMKLMPPIAEFLAYARDVATGLQTIHSKGLAHGSISPKTLLLIKGPGGTIRSEADLNMRAVISPISKGFSSRLAHMNPFMLPPAANRPSCSKAEDIWALGVSWLWCLTGWKMPTGTSAGVDTQEAIEGLWKVFCVSGRVGQRLAKLLKRMTASNPIDRPTVEIILADTLWCHVVEPSIEPPDEPFMPARYYIRTTWAGESLFSMRHASI